MKYEATFGINELNKSQINVEAVENVFINMIYVDRNRTRVSVSTIIITPLKGGSVHGKPWVANIMPSEFRVERLNPETFPVDNFGDALAEFGRQLNFAVGMYSQSGRMVLVGSWTKFVRPVM